MIKSFLSKQPWQVERDSKDRAHAFSSRPYQVDIDLASSKLSNGEPVILNNFHATTVDTVTNDWDVCVDPQRNPSDYVVICRNQLNGYQFHYPLERFSIREVVLDLGRGAVDRVRV